MKTESNRNQLLLAIAFGSSSKAVRIIVPLAPGGNMDVIARSIAQALTESFGQRKNCKLPREAGIRLD